VPGRRRTPPQRGPGPDLEGRWSPEPGPPARSPGAGRTRMPKYPWSRPHLRPSATAPRCQLGKATNELPPDASGTLQIALTLPGRDLGPGVVHLGTPSVHEERHQPRPERGLQRRMQGDDNWYVRAKAKHGEVEFSLFLGFAV
jgi:hypothetical protein